MSKYSIVIDSVKKLISTNSDVDLNFNSEKESAKQFNYLKELRGMIRMAGLPSADGYIPEWINDFFDSNEERDEFLKLCLDSGICNKKIDFFTSNEGDVKHYAYIYGKGSIIFGSKKLTQTYKQRTKEECYQKQKLFADLIGTKNALPNGLGIGKYDTESDIAKKIDTIEKYLNGELVVPACTEKQAEWVSRKLGWSLAKSRSLNKYQASELLDAIFNGRDDVIQFYNQTINESNNKKIYESERRERITYINPEDMYEIWPGNSENDENVANNIGNIRSLIDVVEGTGSPIIRMVSSRREKTPGVAIEYDILNSGYGKNGITMNVKFDGKSSSYRITDRRTGDVVLEDDGIIRPEYIVDDIIEKLDNMYKNSVVRSGDDVVDEIDESVKLNRNNMKNIQRINESRIKAIVTESVKKVLNESKTSKKEFLISPDDMYEELSIIAEQILEAAKKLNIGRQGYLDEIAPIIHGIYKLQDRICTTEEIIVN